MRRIKMILGLGLAVAACALAVAAVPASAHEFVASKVGKVKGVTEEEQSFQFGQIKITCLKASLKGATHGLSSNTLFTETKFLKCHTEGKIGTHKIELVTSFKTPFAIEYYANRFVEVGSESEEGVKLSGGTIELHITAGNKFKCNLYIPEQTLPVVAETKPEKEYSEATYSSTPGKKGPALLIANTFKNIFYELEGEPCEEWGKEEGPESKNGKYTGVLPAELVGGGLAWF